MKLMNVLVVYVKMEIVLILLVFIYVFVYWDGKGLIVSLILMNVCMKIV